MNSFRFCVSFLSHQLAERRWCISGLSLSSIALSTTLNPLGMPAWWMARCGDMSRWLHSGFKSSLRYREQNQRRSSTGRKIHFFSQPAEGEQAVCKTAPEPCLLPVHRELEPTLGFRRQGWSLKAVLLLFGFSSLTLVGAILCPNKFWEDELTMVDECCNGSWMVPDDIRPFKIPELNPYQNFLNRIRSRS